MPESMTLVRHWGVREHAGQALAIGHPAIPGEEVLSVLRERINDRATPTAERHMWWHRSGDAWAAVTDLHKVGRHNDAMALAHLLWWCDRFPRDHANPPAGHVEHGARLWELRPGVHGA